MNFPPEEYPWVVRRQMWAPRTETHEAHEYFQQTFYRNEAAAQEAYRAPLTKQCPLSIILEQVKDDAGEWQLIQRGMRSRTRED